MCTRKISDNNLCKDVKERIEDLEQQLSIKAEELEKVSKELREPRNKVLCLANVEESDNLIRHYTGFQNYGTFKSLFEYHRI